MVVETIQDVDAVGERFRRQGRMLPRERAISGQLDVYRGESLLPIDGSPNPSRARRMGAPVGRFGVVRDHSGRDVSGLLGQARLVPLARAETARSSAGSLAKIWRCREVHFQAPAFQERRSGTICGRVECLPVSQWHPCTGRLLFLIPLYIRGYQACTEHSAIVCSGSGCVCLSPVGSFHGGPNTHAPFLQLRS